MQSRATNRYSRKLRRLAAVASCSMAVAVVPGLFLTPASAAGLLPTGTTVLAAPSTDGTSVTFTATVKLLKILPGLGITPTGTVAFTNGDGSSLGTVNVGACLLTPCVATLNVPVGHLTVNPGSDGNDVDTVTATYSGDALISAGSTGSADVGLSGDCALTDENCFVFVDSSTTSLEVDTTSSTGELTASLGGPALPCSVSGGGLVGNFSATGITAKKTIIVDVAGAAGTANQKVQTAAGHDYMCWVSPVPFEGWTNNGKTTFTHNAADFTTLGDAPQLTSGAYSGDYVALLADCGEHDGEINPANTPCIESQQMFVNESGPIGPFETVISAPSNDPHVGGG